MTMNPVVLYEVDSVANIISVINNTYVLYRDIIHLANTTHSQSYPCARILMVIYSTPTSLRRCHPLFAVLQPRLETQRCLTMLICQHTVLQAPLISESTPSHQRYPLPWLPFQKWIAILIPMCFILSTIHLQQFQRIRSQLHPPICLLWQRIPFLWITSAILIAMVEGIQRESSQEISLLFFFEKGFIWRKKRPSPSILSTISTNE